MFSASSIFASILFSAIGFAAFLYGKKNEVWQPMIIGVVLMLYTYFVSDAWLLYGFGAALCFCLYWFRD